MRFSFDPVLILLAILLVLQVRQMVVHRQELHRQVTDARRDTRRRIVERLRANPRGLVVLDYCHFEDVEAPGPLVVLGDHTLIRDCRLTSSNDVALSRFTS